jgi:hypothetical protein
MPALTRMANGPSPINGKKIRFMKTQPMQPDVTPFAGAGPARQQPVDPSKHKSQNGHSIEKRKRPRHDGRHIGSDPVVERRLESLVGLKFRQQARARFDVHEEEMHDRAGEAGDHRPQNPGSYGHARTRLKSGRNILQVPVRGKPIDRVVQRLRIVPGLIAQFPFCLG